MKIRKRHVDFSCLFYLYIFLVIIFIVIVLTGCGARLYSLPEEDLKMLSCHDKYPLRLAVITSNINNYFFVSDYLYQNGKQTAIKCTFGFIEYYKGFFPTMFEKVDFVDEFSFDRAKYDLTVKLDPKYVKDLSKDSRKAVKLEMAIDVEFWKSNGETLLSKELLVTGTSTYGASTYKGARHSYRRHGNYYGAEKNVSRNIFKLLGQQLTKHPNSIDTYVNYLAVLKEQEFEKKSLPANLIANVHYSDKFSLLPNNTIDAGEQSTITATITNNGKGTAFEVKLNTKCDFACVDFDKVIDIGDIQPGESQTLKIKLYGRLELEDGAASFLIQCTEKRGFDSEKITIPDLPAETAMESLKTGRPLSLRPL